MRIARRSCAQPGADHVKRCVRSRLVERNVKSFVRFALSGNHLHLNVTAFHPLRKIRPTSNRTVVEKEPLGLTGTELSVAAPNIVFVTEIFASGAVVPAM